MLHNVCTGTMGTEKLLNLLSLLLKGMGGTWTTVPCTAGGTDSSDYFDDTQMHTFYLEGYLGTHILYI